MERARGKRKTMTGTVVSNKMDKTVVVEVTRRVLHPTVRKYVRRRARYKAHDEANACAVGDRVVLVETRPVSREKRWRVSKRLDASGNVIG